MAAELRPSEHLELLQIRCIDTLQSMTEDEAGPESLSVWNVITNAPKYIDDHTTLIEES